MVVSPVHKKHRRGVLHIFLAALLLTLAGGMAWAQSGLESSALTLHDETAVYNLAPYLYVTRDPERKLSYKTVYERHVAGVRGDSVRGDALTLGAAGVPQWIVFGVDNRTRRENWVLDFGGHMDGHEGVLEKVLIYDQITRRTYLNTVNAPAGQGFAHGGGGVRVTIAPGNQALFLIYAVPGSGAPATLPFRLMSEQAYAAQESAPLRAGFTMTLILALAAGLFLAAALFRLYWPGLVFSAYYALQIVLFTYQDGILYMSFPLAGAVTGWIYAAVAVAGLFMTREFFGASGAESAQTRATFGFVAVIVAAAALAPMMPADALLRPLLLFAPSLAAHLFLVLLCVAQFYDGRVGAARLLLGWATVLAGAVVTLLAVTNVVPPTAAVVAAYWYALVPQIVLFAAAMAGRLAELDARTRTGAESAETEKESLGYLRQSKEATENQRLQRLIEHERQVMNELREREIQQSEDMNRARVAADEANRAKSAFLAVISHEIRTPMSGILGMARLLLDSGLSKTQRDYAQTIQDSGDAMLALLNDILDFEKIETGKMDLEMVDFDLHRLLHGIVTLMSGHAAAKGIYLKIDMDPAIPRFVTGDPVRLRQVLLNLTGNSIKFTSDGGVTLHARLDPTVSARTGGKAYRIRFSVEDTGIGISKEAQANLFNPFAQADSSIARKFGGSGLGLAISQRLIEAMGGRIMIDSTEGQGSSFFFTLLLAEGRADATRENQKIGGQKPQKALAILIVEDNEINQKLMKEFVDRMGHLTMLAGSGEEALEILNRSAFDMILMDVELPGISGMGTTKAIRALTDRRKAATPVIALTGNVRDEDIRNCFAANMNGHLSKPVDPHKLRAMIDKVTAGTLDNPVILPEGESGKFVQVNRLDAAPEKPVAKEDAFERYDKESRQEESGEPPIRRLALALQDMEISEEDLDEDSFEMALSLSESESAANEGPSPPAADIFDEKMIASLYGSLGKAKFHELIASVFDKSDEIVAALKDKSPANDAREIMTRAHELKGMAGNFGLRDLSDLAGYIEKSIKEGRVEDLEVSLAQLPVKNRHARQSMKTWLDGR